MAWGYCRQSSPAGGSLVEKKLVPPDNTTLAGRQCAIFTVLTSATRLATTQGH
jgi:hypothetical protein